MDRRQQGGKTDDEGRKELMEDEVKSWLPGDSEVSLTKPPAWDKTEEPLIASLSIKCPIMINAGKRALIPLHVFQFNSQAAIFSRAASKRGLFLLPVAGD